MAQWVKSVCCVRLMTKVQPLGPTWRWKERANSAKLASYPLASTLVHTHAHMHARAHTHVGWG